MRAARAPILTYHSLDTSGAVTSLAPRVFLEQMETLRARGMQGIALGELIAAWEGRAELPERPVVLTFDDGYLNFAEHGAPVLARLGFRATLFAVARHCGGYNDWLTQPPGIPRLPLLSHAQLKELAQAGFEIGSHGHDHAPLDRATPAQAETEVTGSKRALEDALGLEVRAFAYPYGRADARARELVRSHYRSACSTELGEATALEDRHFLSRIDVYYLRSPTLFSAFDTPAGRAYLRLRGLGRRARRALLRRGPAE